MPIRFSGFDALANTTTFGNQSALRDRPIHVQSLRRMAKFARSPSQSGAL
jgi:hypothetical protein